MKNKTFVIILFLAQALFWGLIFFRLPFLQNLPWWYWHFRDTLLLSPGYLLISFAISGIALAHAFSFPGRRFVNIALIIVTGYSLQMAFGLAEGRGMQPFRDRILRSGQLDPVMLAVTQDDISDLTVRYQQHMESDLWQHDYLKTKPPGTLLFFMLLERTTIWITGASTQQERLENLMSVSIYLFPFLAMLTVIPLYFLSKFFLPVDQAILPSMLFISSPAVILISCDIDQFLFPLIGLGVLWLGGLAAASDRRLIAFLAGILLFLSLYVSFSLLPLLLLCPMVAGIVWASKQEAPMSVRPIASLIGAGIVGFLVALVVFRFLLHYDMFTRYSSAIAAHEDIKAWMPGIRNVIAFGSTSSVEFACGIGIALTVVFLDHLAATTVALGQGKTDAAGYLTVAIIIVWLGLVALGKVKSESARLWLFLLPVVALAASAWLVKRFPANPRIIVLFVFTLQIITALELKRFQDLFRALI